MKKIITVVSSVLLLILSYSVNAGTIGMAGKWEFTGVVGLNDEFGDFLAESEVTGYFDFTTGTVSLGGGSSFFGFEWNLNGTVSDMGDGSYYGDLITDWSFYNFSSDMLWDITDNGDNTASLFTLDGDGDGITGITLLDGPWVDSSTYLVGTLTAVPVPAAVWLFGSGLIGLIGVARRKAL